jgi:phosphate butyryltransferase
MIRAAALAKKARVAVAQAADTEVLTAIAAARRLGLVEGVLIGNEAEILAALRAIGEDSADYTIIPAADSRAAAIAAVAEVNAGRADAVMKGLLPTATFMRPILDKEKGLRTGRLLSQISVFEWPEGGRFLFITDCAINIAPDLKQKREILENVLELAGALGLAAPKVAVLSALELVNPDMPDTVEAAALAKMGDRGEFGDALVDGPMALDNAISPHAASHKGITSPVAGAADIVLVPDIKVGNALHKALTHLAHFRCGAAVMGARVPIIATSRSDNPETKLLSIAIASVVAAAAK